MKIRPRPVALIAIGLILFTLGLWVWAIHFRAKRAVVNYKLQLIAAGEKLTVDELIPKPVPPEQNSADIFLKAVARLNFRQSLLDSNPPPAMRMVAPGKAMTGWALPDIRDSYENKTTNTWAEADAAIAEISEALELLQQMVEHPTIDFGLDYHQGFTLLLPNLSQTKKAAQRLSAATLCDLHCGDAATAAMNVRAMLALAKASTDERLVISQLVRMAIAAITVSANWELMQSPGLTEAQLTALQRDWAELEFLQAAEIALAMERALGEMTLEEMRNSSVGFRRVISGYGPGGGGSVGSAGTWTDEAEQFAKDVWSKTQLQTKETAWRVAWSYPDQLRTLKGNQVLVDTARLVRSNGCFKPALQDQERKLGELGILGRETASDSGIDALDLDFRSLLSQSVVSLNRVLNRVMTIEASRQAAITAIALKRYQLRHGSYPVALAALVPEFLPAVSRDPVDGQPLRYRVNSDGTFLLYSIGEDGEDNGGDPHSAKSDSPSLAWQRGRDWVWPQPASAEETEAYFESLRKKHSPTPARSNSTDVAATAEQQAFAERYGLTPTNPVTVPTNNSTTNVSK